MKNHLSLSLYWGRLHSTCLHLLLIGLLFTTHTSVFANSTTNCEVSWTTTNTSITITGLSAPHSIFKLFTPDWKIHTNCLDDCTDPLTIKGLTPGATYHLSYNLYDANWSPTCNDLQDVVIQGNEEEEEEEEKEEGSCGFQKLDIFTANAPLGQTNSCNVVESDDAFTFSCTNASLTIDKEGNLVSANSIQEDSGEVVPELNFSLNEADQNFTVSFDGSSERPGFNETITLDPGSGLNIIDIVISNNLTVYDGYLVVGTLVAQDANNTNRFFQYTVKIDTEGNIISAKVLGEDVFGDFFFVIGELLTTQNGYVFDIFQIGSLSLIKFDQEGNFLWKTRYAGDLPSNDFVEFDVTAGEEFIYTANTNNRAPVISKIDLNTGERIYNANLVRVFNSFPGAMIGIEPTADGGLIAAFNTFNTFNTFGNYNYGKLDAAGNLVFQKELDSEFEFVPLYETSDGGILFLEQKDGTFSVMKTTSNGDLSPTCGEEEEEEEEMEVGIPIACDLNYNFSNFSQGDISISGMGLNAEHVIIHVFDSSWKTIFSCFDDCQSSINLEDLAGSYHISINLYDSQWRTTCRELVRVEIGSSFTDSSEQATSRTAFKNTSNVSSVNVYPNPAKGVVYVDLANSISSETTLQIRDQLGRLHLSRQIDENETNHVVVSLEQLKNGFYWLYLVDQKGVITTEKIIVNK